MTARVLWLRCDSGRVIEASADDVVLLLELLESPEALRQSVRHSHRLAKALCAIRPLGLHVVWPASFAAWIADVSRRTDAEIGDLRSQLESWLEGDRKQAVAQPELCE